MPVGNTCSISRSLSLVQTLLKLQTHLPERDSICLVDQIIKHCCMHSMAPAYWRFWHVLFPRCCNLKKTAQNSRYFAASTKCLNIYIYIYIYIRLAIKKKKTQVFPQSWSEFDVVSTCSAWWFLGSKVRTSLASWDRDKGYQGKSGCYGAVGLPHQTLCWWWWWRTEKFLSDSTRRFSLWFQGTCPAYGNSRALLYW